MKDENDHYVKKYIKMKIVSWKNILLLAGWDLLGVIL